jgi:hypothetical protein
VPTCENEYIYISLLLYYVTLMLSKSIIKNLNFSLYLFYAIIISNLYIILRIGILFVNKNDFVPYLEKHFANTGICAIFLAISSILLLNQVYFSKRKINLILMQARTGMKTVHRKTVWLLGKPTIQSPAIQIRRYRIDCSRQRKS